jgi:hypothetical protein
MRFLLLGLVIAFAPVTETAAEVVGRDMKITVYSDGRSCPGGCDAHVVMNGSDNGTANARTPNSTDAAPEKCVAGNDCRVCFDAGLEQCMTVIYRGGGPPRGTFDFTPAFFEAACSGTDLPPRLKDDCDAKKAAARQLEGRLNCIKNPSGPKCLEMMTAAAAAQQADEGEYQKCKQVSETEYNKTQLPARQRALACLYENVPTGRNGAGTTWRKLLPAACIDGKYVGRDGLDCCTGMPLTDGPLDVECRGFYVAN